MKDRLALLRKKHQNKMWFLFIEQLAARYTKNEVAARSGQLTYLITLSIFPFLIIILNILQFTPLADLEVLENIFIPLPPETQKILHDVFENIIDGGNIGLLSFGIIFIFWSSSKAMTVAIKAVNRAHHLTETRHFFKLKALALFFTLALSFIIVLSFIGIIFSRVILEQLIIPYIGPLPFIWDVSTLLIPFLFMLLVFSLLYRFAPSAKRTTKITIFQTLPGAVFASASWILFSLAFSFYVNNFAGYTQTYGIIGGLMILLIWFYFSSLVLILGAEINATLKHLKRKRKYKKKIKSTQ